MSTEKDTNKVDKFDGSNFGFWKMQIEDLLYQKDLYLPLKGTRPSEMKKDDWEVLDRKALCTVRLTLAKSIAFTVKNEKTLASLMASLSSMYEQPSAVNKVHLIKKLFNLKMVEGGKFHEHLNEFNEVTDQLNAIEITFSDEI